MVCSYTMAVLLKCQNTTPGVFMQVVLSHYSSKNHLTNSVVMCVSDVVNLVQCVYTTE